MMLDTMWIWGAVGLVLIAAEIAIGTMDALWFGIAALCLAVVTALFPNISIGVQLSIFAALSITALIVWRRNYQSSEAVSRVGQSQGDEIGKIGTITETCSPQKNGKISFSQGIMGSREWVAVSSEEITVGQAAKIIAVEGNSLRVSAHIN